MPTFTIVAVLLTIATTALLTGVLYRINAPRGEKPRSQGDGSDGAMAPILAAPSDNGDDGGHGGGGGGEK